MAVNMTDEQFQQLLSRLAPGKKGSFAACTSSFDGTKDAEVVEAFLSAITVYKTIENISDTDSLIGILLLLKGEAAIWWQGVKNDVKQWEEFKNCLRHVFVPKKRAYLIYQEIVGDKQNSDMSTESLVAHKRMLFTQLPTEHSEIQQLDMVFGQLNIKIKERIPRNSIANFEAVRSSPWGRTAL
ncbi:activity-regulated cytoskeleton associated protein 2-like [Hyposmocoma kahamanoa]|uniref:activity-regulated cytoskeleton associated protein 2-like n=1 Tax=Hyposmocoma kahamanoa TaxID=1477025 RepID=UPI000E6D80FA|nr:activity-regulated cytoskeleton associated protein 2-like [Hyposmocoma kahamanoa]